MMDVELKTIEISLEEYKELLIIKGRYEELKDVRYTTPKISYRSYSNYDCEERGVPMESMEG